MDFVDFNDYLETLQDLRDSGAEFVICSVINSSGSSPRKSGSKMIVTNDGRTFGTVGGGIIESRTIETAKSMLKTHSPPQTMHLELNEKGEGVCGGSMDIFLEGVYKKHRLVIFGAGHVSEELCRVMRGLDFHIVVFDNRIERLNLDSFSRCERVCGEYSELERLLTIDENTDVIVMTPNHQYDFEVAKRVLRMSFHSLGVMGSKKKRAELINYLRSEGFSDEEIFRVRIPVGIEIGSETPYEIAISIAAELIKLNSRKL